MNERANLTFDITLYTALCFLFSALIFGVATIVGIFLLDWNLDLAMKVFKAGTFSGGIALTLSLWPGRWGKLIAFIIGVTLFALIFYASSYAPQMGAYVPVNPIEVKPINESCVLVVFDQEDGRLIIFRYPQFYGLKLVEVMGDRAIYCEEVDE